jgi:GxxExxY protein
LTEFRHKELTFEIIGAAMEVHRVLGPGFLEQAYQKALERELSLRKVTYTPQQHIQVCYKDIIVSDYYLDLVVEEKVVLELKAVAQLASVHEAQLMSYLHASHLRVGLLFNFGQESFRHKRIAL